MKKLILITSMALGMVGFGCSKSSTSSGNSNAVTNNIPFDGTIPIITDTTTSGTETDDTFSSMFSSGDTVSFKPKSLSVMSEYTNTPGNLVALNNPQNIQINFDLSESESGRYAGEVSIAYIDNGQQRIGTFRAGSGRNPSHKGMYDNNTLEANFNYWYTVSGKKVFSSFFEDGNGAIVLIMEPDTSAGGGNDAEPFSLVYKGAVFFKNFATPKATPYRHCWFIYTGAHDCRASNIQSKGGLVPGSGYKQLGTFTGVTIKKAFNLD